MGKMGEEFLATFNRIESWMQNEWHEERSIGFSELTRRLSRRSDLQVKRYEDDLLEIAQLRNAIVHEKISPHFLIAEPNQWVVDRLREIEHELTEPEMVIPKYAKEVTGFESGTSLDTILRIVHQKGYSQFPIYQKGDFVGLITAHGLGLWLAGKRNLEHIKIEGVTAADILQNDRKRNNYRFISKDTYVFRALSIFTENPAVESLLITKDGNPNGHLLGIIRPKDIFQNYSKEWGV